MLLTADARSRAPQSWFPFSSNGSGSPSFFLPQCNCVSSLSCGVDSSGLIPAFYEDIIDFACPYCSCYVYMCEIISRCGLCDGV